MEKRQVVAIAAGVAFLQVLITSAARLLANLGGVVVYLVGKQALTWQFYLNQFLWVVFAVVILVFLGIFSAAAGKNAGAARPPLVKMTAGILVIVSGIISFVIQVPSLVDNLVYLIGLKNQGMANVQSSLDMCTQLLVVNIVIYLLEIAVGVLLFATVKTQPAQEQSEELAGEEAGEQPKAVSALEESAADEGIFAQAGTETEPEQVEVATPEDEDRQ